MNFLKQSTAVDVLIGPFVDITDGATAETGETPSVKLSKNGQTLAAKNDATTPVHDADGYYNCELDATDTNTVGTLVLTVAATATALPARHDFYVLEEAIYDALFGASAAGFNASGAVTLAAVTHTGAVIPTVSTLTGHTAQTGDSFARIGANGAGLTDLATAAAVTALNDLSTADIDARLEAIHLDHLLAVDYDPASQPGVATALLNELVESDGGVSRFTANALEQAPDSTTGIQLDFTQALPGSPTADTVGDAMKQATREVTAKKNTALSNIPFYMVDNSDHVTPETGLSGITVEISKDGAAFSAAAGTASEIGSGFYQFDATAADMNADFVAIKFTHPNADPVGLVFKTVE